MDKISDVRSFRFVIGNSSWWKAKKYRRETAQALCALRAQGYRFVGKRLEQPISPNTRRYARYFFLPKR